jgi:hypothetical protein
MAAKGGESKRGLIVTLVFCILIIIGLGVSTYLGFSEQDAKEAKAKDALAKYEDMKNDREWVRFQALLTKAYVGVALSKNEQEELSTLGDKWEKLGAKDKGADRDEINKNLKALVADPVLGTSQAAKWLPKVNMRARIKELEDKVAATTTLMDVQITGKEDTIAKLQGEIKVARDGIAEADKKIKEGQDELLKEKTQHIAAIKKEQERYDELSVAKGDDKKKYDKEKAELATTLAAKEKDLKQLTKQLATRTEEITQASPVSLVGRETTSWRVISIDRNGTPLINLEADLRRLRHWAGRPGLARPQGGRGGDQRGRPASVSGPAFLPDRSRPRTPGPPPAGQGPAIDQGRGRTRTGCDAPAEPGGAGRHAVPSGLEPGLQEARGHRRPHRPDRHRPRRQP